MTITNNINIDDKIIDKLVKDSLVEQKFNLIKKCLDSLVNNLSQISLNYESTIPYLSITNVNYHITNFLNKSILIDSQNNNSCQLSNITSSKTRISKLSYLQVIKNFDFILKKCTPKTISLILQYYNFSIEKFEHEINLLDKIINCFFISEIIYTESESNNINHITKIYFTPFIASNKPDDLSNTDSRTFTIKIKNSDFYNEINGIYIHIESKSIKLIVYGLCTDDPLHLIKNSNEFVNLVNKTTINKNKYKTLVSSKIFTMLTIRHILLDSLNGIDIITALTNQLEDIMNCNKSCVNNNTGDNSVSNLLVTNKIIPKKLCTETTHFIHKFASYCFDIKRLLIIYLTTYNVTIAIFLFDLTIKCNNLIAKKLLETLPILIKNIILHSLNTDINISKYKTNKTLVPLDEWFENIKTKYPDELFTEKIGEMIKLVSLKNTNNNSNDSDGKAMQWLETIRKIPFNTFHKLEVYTKYELLLNQINTEILLYDSSAECIKNDSQIWTYFIKYGMSDIMNKNLWIEILNYRKNFITESIKILDDSIYGQASAKKIILNMLSKLCYVDSNNLCIGISGCPGIGKTTIVKEGLAKCLKNSANTIRPFITIPLGGATHASYLEGHGYTYQGSTIGRIIAALNLAKVMNPIIYFDELDKVSTSAQGEEITNLLIHLTDPNQNTEFFDKYCGFPLDLSKCIFVFTFNDISKISRILLDRILHIELEPLAIHQKLHIFKNFALKKCSLSYGFNYGDIIFQDDCIIEIIKTRTCEGGVRKLIEILNLTLGKLKQKLLTDFDYSLLDITILKNKKTKKYETPAITDLDYNSILAKYEFPSKLNSKLLIEYYLHIITNLKYKLTITTDELNSIYLNNLITYTNDTISIPSISGIVYGLYSNKISQGGILKIEIKNPGKSSNSDMIITGNIQDVMKESIKVAFSLTESILIEEKFDFDRTASYFINFPSIATPKDGPSASVIITIGFYSLIKNIPISPYFSATGEINLSGFLTKIGGLTAKINGALLEGIRAIIIPQENYINLRNLIYIEDSIQLYPIKIIYFLYKENNKSKLLIRIRNNNDTIIDTKFNEFTLNISEVPKFINKQAKNTDDNVFIINLDDFDIVNIKNYPTWLSVNNKSLLIIGINNIKDALSVACAIPHKLK